MSAGLLALAWHGVATVCGDYFRGWAAGLFAGWVWMGILQDANIGADYLLAYEFL